MASASNLRSLLAQTDGSAPAIQQSAGAMMKHYDKSAGVAVNEWRNALHQARPDQHLPLLYVCNETLQNSKRNRGNRFLEAFSPVLGQALIFICQKNPTVVEKVRRTVKIWGDRRVFSLRYVNELLRGLEPHRGTGAPAKASPVEDDGVSFSPLHTAHKREKSSPSPETSKSGKSSFDIDKELSKDGKDHNSESSDDDNDDDDLFGDAGDRLLNIELDLDKAASEAKKAGAKDTEGSNRKRQRPGLAKKGPSSGGNKRRPAVLTSNSLMELWNQVSTLQQRFDSTQTLLAGITPEYLDESSDYIDTLVGDELMDAYKKNLSFQKRVVDQRKELHSIAKQRKSLEQEAVRYLPWLEASLKQDKDDIEFCDKVLAEIKLFEPIHAVAKAAREERLAEEARRQRELEELEKKKKEEEDRKKFMEMAMAKQTVAEPGMVWNKATGEYQHRDTDESWRD